MKAISVRGLTVKYEDDAREGINYLLSDLDAEEAKVFFEQAKRKKFAKFEDDRENQYTLSYNPDGTYTLSKREK